jgi:outer membrane protein, heavy metal efflux system
MSEFSKNCLTMNLVFYSLILFACAGHATALTLSLAEIPQRIRTSHPSLKAARMAVAEARARQLNAGRLSNPSVSFESRNETYLSPGEVMASIDQSFPISRRLRLEKQLTGQLVTAAEWEVKDVERKWIAEAQMLAVQILAMQQQQALQQQQTELATQLSVFVAGRAKAGEVSALDAAQAQVEAKRLMVEARQLEGQNRSLIGTLKPMLNLDPDEPLSLSGKLPEMSVPGKGASWTMRADYQLSEIKLIASQTDIDLAKASKWQDLSAGIFAGPEYQNASGDDRRTNAVLGFRISLPLPLWNKNPGKIAEKTATAERARLEQAALAKQIHSEVENARKDMQTSYDLAHETQNALLPLVIQQSEKLEKAYKAGQTDLLTILRTRERHLQIQATALDALRDFHLARIRYEAAIGKHTLRLSHS